MKVNLTKSCLALDSNYNTNEQAKGFMNFKFFSLKIGLPPQKDQEITKNVNPGPFVKSECY